MNILVTGGAGFIGSFLVDELVRGGFRTKIFDSLDTQVHKNGNPPTYLNKNAEFIEGDVRDAVAFSKALEGVDAVCHLAAAVGVGQSQYEIAKYSEVNIQGTANLLDLLVNKHKSVRKLIVASSMSAYGEGFYRCEEHGFVRPGLRKEKQLESKDWELHCPICNSYADAIPTPEEAARNSNSIYAITKKTQEEMCMMIGETYRIPTTALRFFNVYGPRQSLSNPYTGVVAIFMSRLKNLKQPVIFEDGRQTRDFVSVHDVVRAIVMCIESDKANYKIFNVGSGIPLEIAAVAGTIAKRLKVAIPPQINGKFRKGDVRHCFADITKIQKELGFEPKVTFEHGIDELIEWASSEKPEDNLDKAFKELENKGLV